MKEEKECTGILELLEQAITKESEFKAYMEKCLCLMGNPKVKAYLEKIVQEEEEHRFRLQALLDDLKADYAVYEAIVESEEHFLW